MEPFIQAGAGIDVEEIMAAIQKRIQEKKDAGLLKQGEIDEIVDMELQPLPDFLEIPHVYEPILYPGFAEKMGEAPPPAPRHPKPVRPSRPARPLPPPLEAEEAVQETGLAKGVLKKIRSLLFPMIRFMSRPLYSELKTGIRDNQKMSQELAGNLNGLSDSLEDLRYDFLDSLADFQDFKADILDLHMDMQKKIAIVLQSREYICLLHNALHNVIVEASKLKTEEEMLKTKMRILEDKIEFLENRQRALEKR